MIHAELKLRIPRDHCVVIMPNLSSIDGLDNLLSATPEPMMYTFRPVEVLRVGDIVEDCELVDKSTGDRFNIPAGARYRVSQLDVEPPAGSRAMRIFTLVRVA